MSPVRTCACGVVWMAVGAALLSPPVLGANAGICAKNSVDEANFSELLRLADCYQDQGDAAAAIPYLEALNRQMGAHTDPREHVELGGRLASAYLQIRDYRRAYALIDEGIQYVHAVNQPGLAAPLLNDLGKPCRNSPPSIHRSTTTSARNATSSVETSTANDAEPPWLSGGPLRPEASCPLPALRRLETGCR